MKNILNFIVEVAKLKGKARRGWLIHQIKNPETTAEHIFHLAILVWVLGEKKKINLERAIKIALIHDLCEVYAPDLTSYDAVALPEKGRITIEQLLNIKPKSGRPTLNQRKKLEKIKQKPEAKAIKRLIKNLPFKLKQEISNLWLDYENGLTKEARFVKQIDRLANLLQGLIYWKEFGKIEYCLWIRRAKEVLDDPIATDFLKILEKKFVKNKK